MAEQRVVRFDVKVCPGNVAFLGLEEVLHRGDGERLDAVVGVVDELDERLVKVKWGRLVAEEPHSALVLEGDAAEEPESFLEEKLVLVCYCLVEVVVEELEDVVRADFWPAALFGGEKREELHEKHRHDVCRGYEHMYNDDVDAIG